MDISEGQTRKMKEKRRNEIFSEICEIQMKAFFKVKFIQNEQIFRSNNLWKQHGQGH